MKNSEVHTAMLADLARSGLTLKDSKCLKMGARNETQTAQLTGHVKAVSYIIPYFNISGKIINYHRIRFLDPVPLSFNGKRTRYMQPTGSLPRLYLPPLLDWTTVASNIETTIYITEGEKKAARACKDKLPCIGLGGVWSWRAMKKDIPLIEDFKHINWKERKVVIIFDSDLNEKEDVQKALVSLSHQLVKLGAHPYTLMLPSTSSLIKVGLDDYLQEQSVEKLLLLPESDMGGNLSQHLWALNDELAYIEKLEGIYKFKTEMIIIKGTLTEISYANRKIPVMGPDGKVREVSVAKEWLKWEHRRTHTDITYAPGQPTVTEKNELNTWKGWGIEPKKGDITPWIQLLDFIFSSEPDHREWFIQWLAYPLQNPGAKMYTATVLFSLMEGVGKTLIGLTMGRIYGENFSTVTQADIHNGFNQWAANKQFVLGDDITGSDKRQDADLLKIMVSRETITINKKFQPQYTVPDCVNYMLTTNQPDALLMSRSNRRMFVLEILGTPMSEKFYKTYDKWLWGTAGPAALFYHLLNEVDCTSFNPKGHAPQTAAKIQMIELGHSEIDNWAVQLFDDPDSVLRLDDKIINRVFWTATELCALYDPLNQKKIHVVTMSKALRRAGFLAPKLTNVGIKKSAKLWAIRDVSKWAGIKDGHHERAAHYIKERHILHVVKPKKF